MQKRRIALWILIALLSAGFGLAALAKLAGAQDEMFVDWGYAIWFAKVIGVLELAGVILLLIPGSRKIAILLLAVIMVGATYTHVANGELSSVIRPALFAALLWSVWALLPRQPKVSAVQ